jgi:Sec-independent protein translocase protein TatA
MEAEDPLSELADIHLPDAVAFWPPAPGWWVLAVLVLLALVLLYRKQLARVFLRRRLGSALRELDDALNAFKAAPERNEAGLQLLQTFNAVLKRVALVHYADPELPGLNGRAWLRFLDARMHSADFTVGAGQVLGDGIYRPVFNADVDALHALCRRWVEQCYLQPKPKPVPAPKTSVTSASGARP